MSGGHRYNKKQYTDPRDKKRKEIEKSLVHKSNLKKKYFKLLEKEGQAVPEKKSKDDEETKTKKPMTYGERAELVKKRKDEQRQSTINRIHESRETLDKKLAEREAKKKQFKKKTRSGQPAMGPRINTLLDKIKKDIANK